MGISPSKSGSVMTMNLLWKILFIFYNGIVGRRRRLLFSSFWAMKGASLQTKTLKCSLGFWSKRKQSLASTSRGWISHLHRGLLNDLKHWWTPSVNVNLFMISCICGVGDTRKSLLPTWNDDGQILECVPSVSIIRSSPMQQPFGSRCAPTMFSRM